MAIEAVSQRLTRFTRAMSEAGVPYALVGGQAVAIWVASRDPSAVRTTKDIDVLLNRDDLAAARPASIVYLSTVGVYGDHDGAWVDEESPCRPVSKRSIWRLAAEAAWRRFATETGIPVAIIRLSGIYGPGRGPFQKLKDGASRRIIKPGQVFNRIHAGDIAQIVEAVFDKRASGVFNGTDNEPAPPQDVIVHAAGLLGIGPPPEVPFASADLSAMARTFYGENKRVRNDRIKTELGVSLAFPTYREGLAAILEAERQSSRRPMIRLVGLVD